MRHLILFIFFITINATILLGQNSQESLNSNWSIEKINEWNSNLPWINGCNFIPSTAINQIEMWQAKTFDSRTINRELSWAQELGFNTMRVYLSSLVWQKNPKAYKKRINKYLKISARHQIRTIFVFFDDCWNRESSLGKQPDPKPGIHNSGWAQDPPFRQREDTTTFFPILENYVKDIIQTFKNDDRILLWDLYNEPGNSDYENASVPLLRHVFNWARQTQPSQPITSGLWCFKCSEIYKLQIDNSDVLTYHSYGNEQVQQIWIDNLKKYGRPLICTEYMARKNGSLFENVMPLLKDNKTGAISWGFVAGKTNTIFTWNEPEPENKEPAIWFHDILRKDKTPFDQKEIDLIKKMNGKQ